MQPEASGGQHLQQRIETQTGDRWLVPRIIPEPYPTSGGDRHGEPTTALEFELDLPERGRSDSSRPAGLGHAEVKQTPVRVQLEHSCAVANAVTVRPGASDRPSAGSGRKDDPIIRAPGSPHGLAEGDHLDDQATTFDAGGSGMVEYHERIRRGHTARERCPQPPKTVS